ncbi:lipase family protein [Enterobacter nematophilus]|uniref:lipase family protein n=1 Tax=Enterobacter nematophilus TaxID=2994648 RepID=UPI0039C916A0
MTESRTSAVGTFGKAQAPAQKKCWIEIQLVDENNNAVANMPWRGENEASRDKVIQPYSGVTDSEGILRIDDLLHPDLTLFVEAQALVDEMEQRPLSIERTYSYSMKMSPVTVDNKTNNICYYVVIGQLCDKAPNIPGWNSKELPAFHFPDPDFSGLTISNMYFNSRVIVKVCPFRAWNILLHHTKDYSIVNGFNLGLLADFSYANGEKVYTFFNDECLDLSRVPTLLYQSISIDVPFKERYRKTVFIDTTVGEDGEGGTQLFYVSSPKQMLVCWRGTEPKKLADIAADGTFRPIPCPDIISGGQGHKGFLDAFNLAKKKFSEDFEWIEQNATSRELFICGHSLGGSLALIHSAILKDSKPCLYTYGMPRVFTASTIKMLDSITHYRHVNDSDSVTSVPPELELDNKLYDLWGPYGIVYGFIGSFWGMGVQAAGLKFGDPYWHHGNIVCFFKAEQSLVKYTDRVTPLIGMDVKNPYMKIREVLFKKCKFYLVSDLNNQVLCKSGNEQKAFLKCLDEKSVESYFPKNTNPVLDSITNPINHLMSSQYLPYINNQLIELVDPQRDLNRKRIREEFSKQVEDSAKLSNSVSLDEVARNRSFLILQSMLSKTLDISTANITWNNSLVRFKNIAKEEYESNS